MQNNYELMVAIRGSLIESEAQGVYKELTDALTEKHKAKVTFEENWGKINLAYKIAHETTAHYAVLTFEMDGSQIDALELFMTLNTNIIRSLITKIEGKYEPFTKEAYSAGVENFYTSKEERQRKAAPKTRATTAKQLEVEMKNMKKDKTSEDKVKDIINKDLSL